MKYEVVININVDDDSNMLEVGDTSNIDTITSIIESALYDVDDLEIDDIDVVRRRDWKLKHIVKKIIMILVELFF